MARECSLAGGSFQSSSVPLPVPEVPPEPVSVAAPVSEVPPLDPVLSSESSAMEIEVSPPDPPEDSVPASVPTPKSSSAKSSHATKTSSPVADFKKLVRIALLKTKPGSTSAQVRRLVSSLISCNKFVVSPDDVERVVESICNSK